MSATLISFGVALIITLGVLSSIFGLNFLIGSVEFFVGKPQLKILKTLRGRYGLAFGLKWNEAKEPTSFDKVKLSLLAPFSKNKQIDISKSFNPQEMTFAEDLDMGPAMLDFLDCVGGGRTRVLVEVSSSKTGINHQFEFTGVKFQKLLQQTLMTADEYNKKNAFAPPKIYYTTVERSFIAEPLPATGKKLKLATNPEFAGDFQAEGQAGGGAAGAANYKVTKVWIEPGCIVCDACETIYPEVFEVQDKTCVIRPGAPLDNGLRIQEASEACPVEVIKFTRA